MRCLLDKPLNVRRLTAAELSLLPNIARFRKVRLIGLLSRRRCCRQRVFGEDRSVSAECPRR